MSRYYFLPMIQTLRQQEEIMLYGNVLSFQEKEAGEVIAFLKAAYEQESLEYPGHAPKFDEAAALWAAKIVYIAAQLMLYREHQEADLSILLPDFSQPPSPSAVLSADLCLRFLPEMIYYLKQIDSEDALIQVLEDKLTDWHYSGVQYPLKTGALDFQAIKADACALQLYVNRILKYQNTQLAKHPDCNELVLANLGIFSAELWQNFQKANKADDKY